MNSRNNQSQALKQKPVTRRRQLWLFFAFFAFQTLQDIVRAQVPLTLPPTVNDYTLPWAGLANGEIAVEVVIDTKHYKITEITIYKTEAADTSGTIHSFTMTFTADAHTIGWPSITKHVGLTGITAYPYTMTFTQEIIKFHICYDTNDIERLRVTLEDQTTDEGGANCGSPTWVDFDLGGRLIGFLHKTGSDIFEMQPIIDSENGEDAYWDPADLTSVDNVPISHVISFPPSTTNHDLSFLTLIDVWGNAYSFSSSLTDPGGSFANYNIGTRMLTLDSSDACDIGDHPGFSIVLQASTSYSTPANVIYPFTVHITCAITDVYISPTPGPYTYTIGQSDSNVNPFGIFVSPFQCQCLSGTGYTFQINYLKDGIPCSQPSFIQGDPAGNQDFDFNGSDPSEAGVYTVDIIATIPVEQTPSVLWSATEQHILTVIVNLCSTATVNIQSTILPPSSPSYTIYYNIGSGQHLEDFVPADVVIMGTSGCTLEWTVEHPIGTEIIADPNFAYNSAGSFTVDSSDLLQAGSYSLRIIVDLGFTNSDQVDFTVIMVDPCSSTTLSILSSIVSSVNLSYNIGYTLQSESLDDTLNVKVVSSPDVSSFSCPSIEFHVQTQAGGVINAAVFNFDVTTWTLETYSIDLAKADLYPLKIIANFIGYTNPAAELNFEMTLVDTCLLDTFTFTPTAFIATTYSIYTPAITLHTDQSEVVATELTAPCPNLEFIVVNSNQSAIDSSVFTAVNSGATDFYFNVQTVDIAKIDTYDLILKVKYTGALYTLSEDVSFQVIIDDPCQTAALTINPSTVLLAYYSYLIGYPNSIISVIQNDITSTCLTTCPDFDFTVTDQSGNAIDPTLFLFNGATTNDLTETYPLVFSSAGNYDFRINAQYQGGPPGYYPVAFIFDFIIMLIDPCQFGSLTVLPSMTQPVITYDIQTTLVPMTWTFLDTAVSQTELFTVCPDIIITVEDSVTGLPIDPSVFTYDPATQVFEIYTTDQSKHGDYPIKLRAKYDGVQYTNVGEMDFIVEVVDLCLSPTFPPGSQPASQIETIEYNYDSSTAFFDMNPFVLDPVVCPVTYTCTVNSGHQTDLCSIPSIYGTTVFDDGEGDYSLSTDDCVNIQPGTYNIQITGTIGTNNDVQLYTIFDLNLINPCRPECVVSGITTPTIADIEYTIGDQQIEVTFDEFTLDIETNGCPYTWSYSADLSDSSPLSTSYITFEDSTRTFIVNAASGSAQSLEVRLVGQLYGGSSYESKEVTFKLEILQAATPYYYVSNTSPFYMDDITMHLNTILFIEDGSKQIINLGQVTDSEGDDIMISYTSTESFITLYGEQSLSPGTLIPLNETVDLQIEVDMTKAQEGNYSIYIELSDYNDTDKLSSNKKTFEMHIFANNTLPEFVQDITELQFVSFNKTLEAQQLYIGDVVDNEGNQVELTYNDNHNSFITYDASKKQFTIQAYDAVPKNYTVSLQLKEFIGMTILSSQTFVFTIQVLDRGTEIEQPSFYIHKIDQFGVVEVRFTKIMIMPADIAYFNETVFSASIERYNEDDPDDKDEYFAFTWNVTEFTQHSMFMQLYFDYPLEISQHVQRDNLRLLVIDPWPLVSSQNFARVKNETESRRSIPAQALSGGAMDGTLIAIDLATDSFRIFLSSNMLLSNLILGTINMVWGFINSLQIIAHIPLLTIIMPGNASIIYDLLYKIATFDLIEMDSILEKLEGTLQDVDNSADHHFQQSDYTLDYIESTNPFINLSLELTILTAVLLSIGLVLLLSVIMPEGKCSANLEKLRIKLLPAAIIRYGLEEYITFCIVALIKLYAIDFSNWFESASSVFAILLIIFLAAFPVWIQKFLYQNHHLIQQKNFKNKYGSLTDGLQHRKKSAMLYNVDFTVRRLAFAILIIVVPHYNWLQTQLLILKCSFSLIVIGQIEPFKLPSSNTLELANETFILMNTYYMIVYSEFVPDATARYQVGWSNIGLVVLMLLINVITITIEQGKAYLWKLKIKLLSNTHAKLMKERQARQIIQEQMRSATTNNLTNHPNVNDIQLISHAGTIDSVDTSLEKSLQVKNNNPKRRIAKRYKVKTMPNTKVELEIAIDNDADDPYLYVCEDKPDPYYNVIPFPGNLNKIPAPANLNEIPAPADLLISVNHDSIENDVDQLKQKFEQNNKQMEKMFQDLKQNSNNKDFDIYRQIGEIAARLSETPQQLLQINKRTMSGEIEPAKMLKELQLQESQKKTRITYTSKLGVLW